MPDAAGGLDLTITEDFARSMSLEDALNPDNLLCYEMNGAPRRGDRYAIVGAARGAPIADVEVRSTTDPGWRTGSSAAGDGAGRPRTEASSRGTFWTLDWGKPAAGEHSVRSRAFDVDGNVRPAPDDPNLAGKVTFRESSGQITRRVVIP